MSNQIIISSGAKVRNLSGVLTATSGIVDSVGLGQPNGVATLDSSGKVPLSQLPASVITYLGTWNAATNTPTLTNGVGDDGDLYICNVAGTVNFGAGPITFAVGDWVIYGSGTWQKSAGASGTVTSVAVSRSGDALSITGSPITTSGTINIGFAGNSGQYIDGSGNLTTFPSIITQAQNLVTEVYNNTGATLSKGTIVYINGGHGNLPTVAKAIATSDATSAQTYGVVRADITNNNNGYVTVFGNIDNLNTNAYADGTQLYLSGTTAGAWTSTKPHAPIHLVYVGIVTRSHPTQGVVEIRIQNGYELEELHDVAITSVANNDSIFYNSSNDLWENKTIAEVLGYTPANDANVVHLTGNETINGTKTFVNPTVFQQTVTASYINTNSASGLLIGDDGAGNAGALKFTQNTSASVGGPTQSSIFVNSNTKFGFYYGISSGVYKGFYFDNSSLSTNTYRTYTMPNASGTLALTSDIPSLTGYVPYTGATTNVNIGTNNLTSNVLYTSALYEGGLWMNQNSTMGGGESTTTYTSIKPYLTRYLYFSFGQASALKRFRFDVNGLTDNTTLTYTMPNASGTLALTSDIPSLTNYVTLTGSQTITGIKTFTNEQLFGNGITLTGGYITYTSGSFNLTLNTNILTANRNVFIKDGSGTLAFTSDIPSLSGYVQGSGTTNYHAKFTASGTIGNSMLTDDGTTLQSIGATRSNFYLKAASSSYYSQLAFTNGSNGSFGGISYNNSGQYMQFETNSSEWMRLYSNGNLRLFSSSSTDNGDKLQVEGGVSVIGGNLAISKTSNSSGTYGQISFPQGPYNKAAIRGYSVSSIDAGELRFYTAPDGDILAERMRITSQGNVGIGVTPSIFDTIGPVLQMGRAVFYGYSNEAALGANFRYEGGDKYINTDYACLYQMKNGTHVFSTAPIGTGGTSVALSARMIIRRAGDITNSSNGVINQTFSKQAYVDVNGYVDIDTETGGGNYNGILIASNTYIYNGAIRSQGVYAVLGRGTTISITTLGATNGSTDSDGFNISAPSAGIIRVRCTGYNASSLVVTWFGNQS